MPKVTIFIFVIFVIFRALKLVWKVKKKHQTFSRCSILCGFFTEKFVGVIFHIPSIRFTRTSKKGPKLTISSDFWSYPGTSN